MKNSITYLTRKCPRNCSYCSIKNPKKFGKELTPNEWIRAFNILKELDVTFNLILGNEPWLYREKLVPIFTSNKVPYALYTTCPSLLFERYKELFFGKKIIDNLSCGIDYPKNTVSRFRDDSIEKSNDAWRAFAWIKEKYPEVDTQGTITVHKKNLPHLYTIISQLTELGVFAGINMIHWNKDGKYDFFPAKAHIPGYLFEEEDLKAIEFIFKKLLGTPNLLIHNPEYLHTLIDNPNLVLMNWHCGTDPTGGPTIDADGTLRVCGYRKGKYTSKYTIFDLPERLSEWKVAVAKDAQECPGCIWSCAWMYHYWKTKDPIMGELVYTNHAGNYIPKDKWSKRDIE